MHHLLRLIVMVFVWHCSVGNLSEAMLLAGETEAAGGLVVRLLVPPAGSEPGEQIHLQGGQPSAETVKQVGVNRQVSLCAWLCAQWRGLSHAIQGQALLQLCASMRGG